MEQLQTELVNAVFDALRQSAVAALGIALTPTGRLFNFSEADIARVRPAARQRPAATRGRARTGRKPSSVASSQLALPLRDSSPPPQDTAFTITDPSVLLASVQAEPAPLPPVQKIPSRRGRKPREPRVLQAPQEVVAAEPEVALPPALRDGEEVAKAVLGGGVVLRRRRT